MRGRGRDSDHPPLDAPCHYADHYPRNQESHHDLTMREALGSIAALWLMK